MKKQVSLLVLSGLLSACVANDSIPIRSSTVPRMRERSTMDRSSVSAPSTSEAENNFEYNNNHSHDDENKASDTSVSESSVMPKPVSMVEEVNCVKDVKTSDLSGSNFAAKGNYKIGNPYLIDGVSYYPHEDYSYSEVGIASWYGPNFHGGKTSNGEVFDETKFTAAHRTLPMPSLVKVTNLENGTSINVKVNDRGPYARDRILDLSSAAADVLGVKQKGTARVKVEILPEQSKHLKTLALASSNTDIYPIDISYSSSQIQKPEEVKPVVDVANEKANETPTIVAPAMTSKASYSSTSAGDYFVQVAAYSTYEKAENLKKRLANIGTVKIFKAVVNGNILYKVRLGEFNTKEQAEQVQREVQNIGISGSRVILRENGSFSWNIK